MKSLKLKKEGNNRFSKKHTVETACGPGDPEPALSEVEGSSLRYAQDDEIVALS